MPGKAHNGLAQAKLRHRPRRFEQIADLFFDSDRVFQSAGFA
ncbi:hypothetical protein HMPREF0972_02045 [Actinomyces sp. oral taxon 848 str. F0332]|nr:hypothetical protein HMPREF0972_02045 [Actinomyces sp. oral taxon 848 str. F0332]